MAAYWVRDIDGLCDFIGYVVVYAPNRFPKQDYLADHEQMTLEKAFRELKKGVLLVERESPGADKQRGLTTVLDDALASYRKGDEVRGAHRLQDFQNLIFKSAGSDA